MEGMNSGKKVTGFKLKTGIKKTVGSTKVKDLRNPRKFLHRNDASGSLIQREQQQAKRKYHECVSY